MSVAPRTVHVAAASLNQTVGDWRGNRARIVQAMQQAQARGARLLLLPELCISGYSLGDRLLRRGTLDRSWQSLVDLLPHSHGLVTAVGLPIRHNDTLYNAVAVIADGRIWGLVAKENLATGDVQYENRWYGAWPPSRFEQFEAPDGSRIPIGRLLFDAPGLGRFGVEVCEDGWKGLRPGSIYALAGARILLNPSASWFVTGKHRARRELVAQVSREDRIVYLYSSLLGCDATRLIFDGSVFIGVDGRIAAEGRRFRFHQDVELVDRVIDMESLVQGRMEEGSWRDQVATFEEGGFGPAPHLIEMHGQFDAASEPPTPEPYWLDGTQTEVADASLMWLAEDGLLRRAPTGPDLPHLELELALAMGLREYSKKSHVPNFALALSGGRDSAMVALLVQRAFRYAFPELNPTELRAYVREHFFTAYMGTDHSSSATRAAAAALADELGTTHYEGAIQDAVSTHLELVRQMTGVQVSWSVPEHDIPLQNVQARLRGSLIWMVANLHGALLLATSNKSECAVGYATMDGDTSGGLSPIADVPKSLVALWLRWAADFHGYTSLEHVLATPATAELRPAERAQTDEGDLMPYDILDRVMYHFVQLGQDPVTLAEALWPALGERYEGDRAAFAEHIRLFVRKFCFAQWKRERFAISFRVMSFDLDPKGGFRFPAVQAPFTEELAELDGWVAQAEG